MADSDRVGCEGRGQGQGHGQAEATGLGLPAAVLRQALGLALASAVSLGLARFAYTLLLPAMREDLAWTYATAGAMNTVNAAGYLLGALLLPRWQSRHDGRLVVLVGGLGACIVLAAHGMARGDAALYMLRLLSGLASAASFAGGGLLAARLAQQPGVGSRSGLVLGIYYGGTGAGIVCASVLMPLLEALALPGWRIGWGALGFIGLLATVGTAALTRGLECPPGPAAQREAAPLRRLLPGLLGYLMFGLGYIGYMTFVITLLREQGLSAPLRTAFYVVLGLGVMASSALWAGLLQRHRDGRPLSQLNALLAAATLMPVVSAHPVVVFTSGLLFGSVFLSVVASTTALVRHNLPPQAWASGIAAFTIIFAGGQIVGPVLVGAVADAAGGGLSTGFVLSAGLLALGALLARYQRALVVMSN